MIEIPDRQIRAALFIGGTHDALPRVPRWHFWSKLLPIGGTITPTRTSLAWRPRRARQWLPSIIDVVLDEVQQIAFDGEGRAKVANVRFRDGQSMVFAVAGRQLRPLVEDAGLKAVDRASWPRRWIAAHRGEEVEWPDGSRSVVT